MRELRALIAKTYGHKKRQDKKSCVKEKKVCHKMKT